MTHQAVVIGTGPAGMATALALLEKGVPVTLLDAGVGLEPEIERFTQRLSKVDHHQWSASERESLKVSAELPMGGIQFKRIFNSDYPYRDTDRFIKPDIRGAETWASLALGGLSNVWGSAVMPYHPNDIEDWCVTADELAPHYRSVLAEMPLAAVRDDLEAEFPLYKDQFHALQKSRQAQTLYRNLEAHRSSLRDRHMSFGHSRLTVANNPSSAEGACRYCSMCLYGCPYRLIYSSAYTISRWVSEGRLQLLSDRVVQRLREEGEEVVIEGIGRLDGQPFSMRAGRVYVATGPVSTARIMLESMGRYDNPIRMLDSQYYLFPYIQYRASSGIMQDDLNTLCQLFLEIRDTKVTKEYVHLQVYSYSDLFLRMMRQKSGFLFPLVRPFVPVFLNRMMLIMGYLHSRYSGHIEISLGRNSGNTPGRLRVEGVRNPETDRAISRVLGKLWSVSHMTGAFPMRAGMQVTDPGRGFHSGGTFPMSDTPGVGQSDPLGRPHGFHRVHLTDSSVLPAIPATTITLAVMANAHRIASRFEEG